MKLALVFAFWCALIAAAAQDAGVAGSVQAEGKPVPFAHVVLKPLQKGTLTDTLGRFTIAEVEPGTYQLEVTSVGFVLYRKPVTLKHGDLTEIQIDMLPDVSQLDEVVVTGTMREVTRLNSPIAVEVFSPALFRKNPTPSVFESLSIVNGVQPQINCNVCNTGDIHINGLEGPYTMILIDGMPIVSSLATVYGLSGIPNSMVKRVEVVKGPASTLYGSEAVGGVINIITHDAAFAPRLQADVFGTTEGEYNADVTTSMKLGKASGLLGINAFNFTRERDINNDNFTDVTLQQRISLFNKWSFHRKSGKNFSLAARYVYEDRWGGELQWRPEHRGTDIFYGESIYTRRGEFISNYQLPGKEDINIDVSYNFHQQDSYYGLTSYDGLQHTGFAQVRWSKQMGRHSLLAGIPVRYIYYDDNTPGTALSSGVNSPSRTLLPGIFIQDEWTISKLTLLTGARYDRHNVHGNIFTPRVSVKWSPTSTETFRITTGSGFRVVNLFTEDHAALSGSREVIVKSELKPEQSWNVNASYSKVFTHAAGYANLDFSAFYTYFTNRILGDFNSNANQIIYDNLDGHAVSRGITANADLGWTNGFKLISGITWMDVYLDEVIDGESVRTPQIHAPRFSGTFTASYTNDRHRITFDLTGRVNGPMHLPVVPNDFRPGQSPWFALLNVQVTKAMGQWEIYGGVKNLLNFIPRDPLLRPFDPFDRFVDQDNPFGYTFDASYNYAPVQSIKGFLGVLLTLR